MSNTTTLLNRNRQFASDFAAADLPILPKLRTVVRTCGDARVDPAHVLGRKMPPMAANAQRNMAEGLAGPNAIVCRKV